MSDNEQVETAAPAETEGATAPENTAGEAADERNRRKVRIGLVTSNKMDKTVTVIVERRFAHPLYGKGVKRTTRYHAHDENNAYQIGDTVRIVETRPLSKMKRWRVIELIDRQV
jgi:small subunit ribosomal protein S17